jgi:transposase-like protein
MTSRTKSNNKEQTRDQRETRMPHRLEHRRQQAIARYLAGDKIETICREMGCAKSWLYKWRDRYQADNPTWTQEWSRRPETSPAQLSAPIEEDIMHLRHALLPQSAGPASAAAIQQALKDKASAPVPSLRTIYRVLQRHAKEVTQPRSMP